MKYRTKEWYQLCQWELYQTMLTADERAEIFSEEFYQERYQQELNKLITEMKERYEKDPKYGIKYGFSETYNQEEIIAYFKRIHEMMINVLKKNLPAEILAKIADIRVFQLGLASAEVIDYVTIWCEANEEQTTKINKEFFVHYRESPVDEKIREKYAFHDSVVIKTEKTDQDFIIEFEPDFSPVTVLILHNYRIIELECDLTGAWWLYDEVYAVEGGNEYHSLVQPRNGPLAHVTIFATDVEFIEYTES